MNEPQSQPHLKARKNVELSLSPIWFLPIIAVVISAWLLVKLTLESKVPITIQMTTAQGIVAGKTEIKFRGISAGQVTRIEVAESLGYVIVHAEIEPSLSEFLTTETKFWVVRAQISLAGVSGLDTVLSGDYIAFEPGKEGNSKRNFVAQSSAPPIGEDDPGLRITLTAENLGSVSEGSQLYYRQIPIGEVRFFELSQDTRSVQISALINPDYRHLVNSSTVFWNSGGVRLSGSLSGFEVKTESLSAILAGGISLFTPDPQANGVDIDYSFTLHEDYDDAGVGVPIKIAFSSGYDLQSGITKVKFHGINVGHLDSINVVPDEDSGVIANVVIDPGAEPLLVEDTQFWLVKPNLSFRNLSNLDTLISGNYITLKTGDATESRRDFVALDKPPPPDLRDPGLHVFLKAKSMGSINIDTPVLYKGVEVGRVANTFIDNLTEGVGFHLHIRPEHADLINSSSRFWDESGLDVSAGLGGLQIRSTSLMNIVRGGIAFQTDDKDAPDIKDGHQFNLLDSPLASETPLKLAIEIPSGDGLIPGVTPVKYKGMPIGAFKQFEYSHDDDRIIAHVELNNKYSNLITDNTSFWLVTPRLGATSIEGLDTLFGGPYLTFKPAPGKPATEFILAAGPVPDDMSADGLQVELVAATTMGLQPGSPVYYRKLEVGEVHSMRLTEQGVKLSVFIKPAYKDQVRRSTRFWNASGIEVKAGAGGVNVRTEGLGSVLAGGIAFGMADTSASETVVGNGEQFKLYANQDAARLAGTTITLKDNRALGIAVGAAIRYKGLQVGEVTQQALDNDDSVMLTAQIAAEYDYLLRTGTVFWIAKPELGLTKQENLAQLFTGPEIRIQQGDGDTQKQFILATTEPVTKSLPSGLNLILETPRLGSVKKGTLVYYRQIPIGEVLGYQLTGTADKVKIYINVADQYQALIRTNSKFWNASGLSMSAGLFSGVDIKTESVEALLAGGLAVATPEDFAEAAGQNAIFQLEQEGDDDWLDWQPIIPLKTQ